ncbi:MAG TPA: bifunctional hydroxymethylpyrimidine kinase/phosphomethylpyrimidine kinase [Acidimicrobiales bacterium]|jgi:hydroxymethylpyrimidine/phosphomethylpyrimidine kinase|nr:bifunctional hydroxymethylpyrimidine kinase/phosphomethylpyrimidine kinase [Acidimicrobiales bacterium]
MAVRPPVALTIAGSDSGGGAGIEADLKTFEAHGVWGAAAVVAVTAQNTLGVQAFEPVSPSLVRKQIESVVVDIGVDGAKTGMLASAALVSAVAGAVRDFGVPRLVVDPVFVSKHGDTLLADDAVGALRHELLPLATVVTPNLPEAAALVGFDITDRAGMEEAARALSSFGAKVVLVKGGHLGGGDSPDLVLAAGAEPVWLESRRIEGRHTHGTGCVLSAAIAAELARGMEPADACVAAKRFIERAIAAGVELGRGIGPVNPGWERAVSGT